MKDSKKAVEKALHALYAVYVVLHDDELELLKSEVMLLKLYVELEQRKRDANRVGG